MKDNNQREMIRYFTKKNHEMKIKQNNKEI